MTPNVDLIRIVNVKESFWKPKDIIECLRMYLWTPKPNRNHQKTNIYETLSFPGGGDIPPFGSLPYIYIYIYI